MSTELIWPGGFLLHQDFLLAEYLTNATFPQCWDQLPLLPGSQLQAQEQKDASKLSVHFLQSRRNTFPVLQEGTTKMCCSGDEDLFALGLCVCVCVLLWFLFLANTDFKHFGMGVLTSLVYYLSSDIFLSP